LTPASLTPLRRDNKPVARFQRLHTVPLSSTVSQLCGRRDEHHHADETFRELCVRQVRRHSRLSKKLVNEVHTCSTSAAQSLARRDAYMNTVLEKIATRVPAPILVDSTEAQLLKKR